MHKYIILQPAHLIFVKFYLNNLFALWFLTQVSFFCFVSLSARTLVYIPFCTETSGHYCAHYQTPLERSAAIGENQMMPQFCLIFHLQKILLIISVTHLSCDGLVRFNNSVYTHIYMYKIH